MLLTNAHVTYTNHKNMKKKYNKKYNKRQSNENEDYAYCIKLVSLIYSFADSWIYLKHRFSSKHAKHCTIKRDSNNSLMNNVLKVNRLNINRFDDICWYLPLCFMLIVWLRFVNHLLNYYLLTYLLRWRCFSQAKKTFQCNADKLIVCPVSDLTVLVLRQEGHPARKNIAQQSPKTVM